LHGAERSAPHRATIHSQGRSYLRCGLPADGPLDVDAFALNVKEQIVKGRFICTPKECQDMSTCTLNIVARRALKKPTLSSRLSSCNKHYESKDLQRRICVTFL